MRSLLVSGGFCDVRVKNGKLVVIEGFGTQRLIYEFNPRNLDFENVVITNPDGNISLSALYWLSRNNIPVLILNYDGELTSIIQPPQSNAKSRLKQYDAYLNDRVEIGRQFIMGKIKHTEDFLNFLKTRYDIDLTKFQFKETYKKLREAKTLKTLLGIEGITANLYWTEINRVFAESKFPMGNRDIGRTNRPMNAVDEINALLNYGYTYLQSLVQKALNSNGLDTSIGFVHEIASGKRPLTYDFLEPFRFLVDWSIIKGMETKVFNKNDFTRDLVSYNLRLKKSGIDKLIRLVQDSLSTRVHYKGADWQWYTLIYDKTREFSKDFRIDLTEPSFNGERTDTKDMRTKILNMTYKEWKEMGFSKGSLWYMKHNIENGSFKLYEKTLEKLEKT